MILLFSDLEHYSDIDFESDLQQISSQRFEKVYRLRFGDDKKSKSESIYPAEKRFERAL